MPTSVISHTQKGKGTFTDDLLQLVDNFARDAISLSQCKRGPKNGATAVLGHDVSTSCCFYVKPWWLFDFCALTTDFYITECPSSQYGTQILSSRLPLSDSPHKLQHGHHSHSQRSQSLSSFGTPQRFSGASCSGLWICFCPIQLFSRGRAHRHVPGWPAEPSTAPVTVPAHYNSLPTSRLPSGGHVSPPEVNQPRRTQPKAHVAHWRVLMQCKIWQLVCLFLFWFLYQGVFLFFFLVILVTCPQAEKKCVQSMEGECNRHPQHKFHI